MSYTIDVYRGKMRAVSKLLDVTCFIGFFRKWWRGQSCALSRFSATQSPGIFERRCRGALVLSWRFFKKACVADG